MTAIAAPIATTIATTRSAGSTTRLVVIIWDYPFCLRINTIEMLSINLEGACKFFTGWFLWEEVRFWRGGHARNRVLFIISGSERGELGNATRMLVFSELALCPHAVRDDLPQGAGIASQGPHVDENRPISGRLGRSNCQPPCERAVAQFPVPVLWSGHTTSSNWV